jgi:hypothetical protein
MYTLTLTYSERQAIDWINRRYWNGSILYSILQQCSMEQWDDKYPINYNIPEYLAWEIKDYADSEGFPCFSPNMVNKFYTFIDSIV